MKCSEQVKLAGLKSLRHFSEIVEVPETTLRDWSKNKPRLFEVLLMGAVKDELYTCHCNAWNESECGRGNYNR